MALSKQFEKYSNSLRIPHSLFYRNNYDENWIVGSLSLITMHVLMLLQGSFNLIYVLKKANFIEIIWKQYTRTANRSISISYTKHLLGSERGIYLRKGQYSWVGVNNKDNCLSPRFSSFFLRFHENVSQLTWLLSRMIYHLNLLVRFHLHYIPLTCSALSASIWLSFVFCHWLFS